MKKERRVAAQVRRKSSPAESRASAKVLRAHACCQEQREATLAFTGAGGRGTDEQKGRCKGALQTTTKVWGLGLTARLQRLLKGSQGIESDFYFRKMTGCG